LVQKKIVQKKRCPKCNKDKPLNKFYNSTSSLFPDGMCNLCSDCFIEDIDCNDIESVKAGLMKLDLPFYNTMWGKSNAKVGKHPFRDYVRMCNSLPQYKNLKWKDSDTNTTLNVINSDEEKSYSKQWMGDYTESDIEYLDNYLKGLHTDFKIITENHKDYAKKIAKASLHMDKCFQDMLQGISGADKRYKDARETFDTMSKSAQFSENTRGINDVSLGGFGVVFDRVEQQIWIPKHVPLEKDDFDKLIDYFSSINKSV